MLHILQQAFRKTRIHIPAYPGFAFFMTSGPAATNVRTKHLLVIAPLANNFHSEDTNKCEKSKIFCINFIFLFQKI